LLLSPAPAISETLLPPANKPVIMN
jgi:hypothetical protein